MGARPRRHLWLLLLLLTARRAGADDRRYELGAAVSLDALGSYDVGEGLGGSPGGDDLGPATLGVVVQGAIFVGPKLTVGAEGGIAVGGLVGTDERYFGARSNVGSTATVWARARLGWSPMEHEQHQGWVGASLGMERMSEATGLGSVHLDSIVGGPWLGLRLGAGLTLQLAAEVHVPVGGRIGEQADGDPGGVFWSGGIRVAYLFGLGRRGP